MRYLAAAIAILLVNAASSGAAERCIASVYGTGDHDQTGTETASGIPLNDALPSVAHQTRPLKSWVRVTNLDTGRFGWFPITDRGPYVAGRCLDLSHAVAAFIRCDGLCRVEVQ